MAERSPGRSRYLYLCGLIAESIATAAVVWGIGALFFYLKSDSATCAMGLLLSVLLVSTFRRPLPAVVAAIAATLTFSWYFIEYIGSLVIRTPEGWIAFLAMLGAALIGSFLSVRASQRAAEAERRRNEIEKLHLLETRLLTTVTAPEAAQAAAVAVMELFAPVGVAIQLGSACYKAGDVTGNPVSVTILNRGSQSQEQDGSLEFYGDALSAELRSALASIIDLVIARARSSDERNRIEVEKKNWELRSTVLNALAHDFKTPLTSIRVAASALSEAAPTRSDGDRELARVIDEEASRLSRQIRESLDLARLREHQISPRFEPCRIADVVQAAASWARRYGGRRPIDVNLPDNSPITFGDRFMLEQMLIQVMDNAVKYSAAGSRVEIDAIHSSEDIVISIRNDGSEIPESERQAIFDPFFRGARDRKAVEGTGLGLSIARTIAEAHGGRFWLADASVGPVFCFALPASPAAADN